MNQSTNPSVALPRFSKRKFVHMSMLVFALLLPFLTWMQAAGCALMALVFNVYILPQLDVDLRKSVGGTAALESRTGIVVYPVSVLALILLYRHEMYVAASAWAIMALGDGMASIAGDAVRGPALPWNHEKRWSGFAGFVIAGTVGAYALARWVAPELDTTYTLAVCALAALVGAAVESLPIRLDDNVSVPLVCGAFMYGLGFVDVQAFWSNWPFLPRRLALALAVNLVFAVLALVMRWVTRSGAAMGFVLGSIIYLSFGYKSFLILLAFILLGSIATKLGFSKKAARGIAEHRGGARSWREALANCLAPAFFAILSITAIPSAVFVLALVAALAEAAGDTISSEIGQWLSDRVYLITTFEAVPTGVDGGISFAGSVAGVAASTLIVGLAYGLHLCGPRPLPGAAVALVSAVAGNLVDSLLGATIERKGLVTNGIVNFSGTSFAGAVALVLAFKFRLF